MEQTDVGGFSESDALTRSWDDSVAWSDVGNVGADLEDDGVARFLELGVGVVGDVEGAIGANEWDVGNDGVGQGGDGVEGSRKR